MTTKQLKAEREKLLQKLPTMCLISSTDMRIYLIKLIELQTQIDNEAKTTDTI